MDVILKNGHLIDPAMKLDGGYDILISAGKIKQIKKKITGKRELDLSGKYICPGFIDMHVHLREPGYEYKENIETGSKAAVYGGFTSVACMPNTKPAIDNKSVIRHILSENQNNPFANVFPIGAITKDRAGKELCEIAEMYESGVVAISDDGSSIMDASLMRKALEYAKMFDLLIIDHAEDSNLAKEGVMNEGYWSTVLGLAGIPNCAEDIIVARDIGLSEITGARIHIAHVSTKGSMFLIKEAKKRGVKVTCEVTPHHLILSDENLVNYDTYFKVNPPLRSKEDVKALRAALKEGVIDVIATDHAPHAEHEKKVEFNNAPFGIIGLETAVPLILTEFGKTISLEKIVEKFSTNPAKILNLKNKGLICEGYDADFTVLDLVKEQVIDINNFVSKAKNSPFDGFKTIGGVSHTIVGGKVFSL